MFSYLEKGKKNKQKRSKEQKTATSGAHIVNKDSYYLRSMSLASLVDCICSLNFHPLLWFVNLRDFIIVTDYRQSLFHLCFYLPANTMVSTLRWVQFMDTQGKRLICILQSTFILAQFLIELTQNKHSAFPGTSSSKKRAIFFYSLLVWGCFF